MNLSILVLLPFLGAALPPLAQASEGAQTAAAAATASQRHARRGAARPDTTRAYLALPPGTKQLGLV